MRISQEIKDYDYEYFDHFVEDISKKIAGLERAFIEKMVNSGARLFLADGEFVSRNWKFVFDMDEYNQLFRPHSYHPDEIEWLLENAELQPIEGE